MNSKDIKLRHSVWGLAVFRMATKRTFQKGKSTQGRSSSTSWVSCKWATVLSIPYNRSLPFFHVASKQVQFLSLLISCYAVSFGRWRKSWWQGRQKARKLKFVECLESVIYSLFNPQKPSVITMIPLRLVKFSDWLKGTQLSSSQTRTSV